MMSLRQDAGKFMLRSYLRNKHGGKGDVREWLWQELCQQPGS